MVAGVFAATEGLGDKGGVEGGGEDCDGGGEEEGELEAEPDEPGRAPDGPESPGPLPGATGAPPDAETPGLAPPTGLPAPAPRPGSAASPGGPEGALLATLLVKAVRRPRSPKTIPRAGSSGRRKSQTSPARSDRTNITITMSMPVMRARTGAAPSASQAGQTVPALSARARKVLPH